MKKWILFLNLSLINLTICLTVKGQILKIEKANLNADTSNVFKGNIGVDYDLNNRSATAEENIVYQGLEASANLTYLTRNNAYLLINKINYNKITNGPLISTGYSHIRSNFYRKRKLSYELFGQVQYDDGRRMPLRYLGGGGIKIRILEGDKGSLFAGIGIMNEVERWKQFGSDEIIHKQIWKNTDYLSGTIKASDNFRINITYYYQGGYDDEADNFRSRISGDIEFAAKIKGKLAFTTNFILLYESDPIIAVNPLIYSISNGLSYSF